MTMKAYWQCALAAWRYRGYLPRPVTIKRFLYWIAQFDKADRNRILQLLENVVYFPESLLKTILIQQNTALMTRLQSAGLPPDNLIYVQVDDAGSSSPVMLNMLRDAMGLAQRGCHLLDGKDVLGIAQTTAQLGQGALIYVDDFVGSGVQLCDARDYVAANVVGTFSEFALIPTICEEGYAELAKRGVETYSGHLHSKVARPLHANSSIFDRDTKNRLIEICNTIDPVSGLGFLDGAVMVVLYRGPPDNVPIILRGNPDQTPYAGLFPRYSDLPLPTIA
jgi:hypothetical protein